MDFIREISKAIDFIEINLKKDITYKDVAEHIYVSCYHFHRIFSMVTGMAPKEYIRNRRLSEAGKKLLVSDEKVIDIALEYGYKGPESFAKAFKRFHGVSPKAAKKAGASLRLFNRLVIKIVMEGGNVMDYRIEEKEAFKVLAKVRKFKNSIINQEGNTDIPDFWSESKEKGVFKILQKDKSNDRIYGLCAPLSKESDEFAYGIGAEYANGEVPEGYEVWEVKPKLWAVFKCIGENPECIGETWDKIFKEFLPSSDYIMEDDVDYELYTDDFEKECFCEVWIPVRRK